MTRSIPVPPGAFTFDATSGTWTWSEQVYPVYGFRPGEVVPTTDLVMSHQHPDDRGAVEDLLRGAVRTGAARALFHRLVAADGGTRQVLTLCAGSRGGRAGVVEGFVVDLTEAVRRTASHAVDEAMELMAQSRPAIEQAKGALMLTYGLAADDAFELLRRYSQRANVKLRDVAREVTEALPDRRLPAGWGACGRRRR